MATKVHAAQIACNAGIATVVMNGSEPEDIYKVLDGHRCGTLFKAVKNGKKSLFKSESGFATADECGHGAKKRRALCNCR